MRRKAVLAAPPAPLNRPEDMPGPSARPKLTLRLAAPRGFCAGVDRAIRIVELAIEKWGAPVFVRHEIVHNRFVVDSLKAKGAVFVEELSEVPDGVPVVFSAHGVPKAVPAKAEERGLEYVDATCPLVSKVHIEAERHYENGLQMVMIGHAGHPETLGTMGQLPEGEVILVETVADVATITPRDPARLAFITQTTLSVDDTADIVAALKARFPAIIGLWPEVIPAISSRVRPLRPGSTRLFQPSSMFSQDRSSPGSLVGAAAMAHSSSTPALGAGRYRNDTRRLCELKRPRGLLLSVQ